MTCANCSSEAIYLLSGPRVSDVYYCGRCLPAWFRQDAAKGRLNIPKADPEPAKKKKAEPVEVVEEVPVAVAEPEELLEDAPVEEAPVEE